MTLTKAQLRDRIGDHMGLAQESADLSGYQQGKIDQGIDDCFEMLAEKGLNYWPSNEIPQELAIPLRDYIAGVIGETLVSLERAAYYRSKMEDAIRQLLALLRAPEPTRINTARVLPRFGLLGRFR